MHERLLRQPEKLEDTQVFTREKSKLWSVTPLAKNLLRDITENDFSSKTRSCNTELVTPLAKSVADSYLNKLGLADNVVLRFAPTSVLEEKMKPDYREKLESEGRLKKELEANKTVTGYQWKEDLVIPVERKNELSKSLDKLVSDAHTAQQDITTAHIDLANWLAKQYLHKKRAAFDPAAEAYLGLTKAAQRFDWRRGYNFQGFASATMHGEIVRALRDHGETIRKPRLVFEKTTHVLNAQAELEQEGKPFDSKDIAKKIGVPVADIEAVKEYRSATSLDSDTMVDSSKPRPLLDILPDSTMNVEEDAIDKRFVQEAIDLLDARSKVVIFKLFYEGKSQQQVGDEMGISQMHISRMRTRALVKMRELLNDNERSEAETASRPKERRKRKVDSY